MSECLLTSQFKSCCCNCKNRMKLVQNDPPFEQVGWVCNLAHEYGESIVHVGDFEHGICECNDPIRINSATPRPK